MPINCGNSCWKAYYLYDPSIKQFKHCKDWDYLRIHKIDKRSKQILAYPDGNAFDDEAILYQVKGLELLEIKE